MRELLVLALAGALGTVGRYSLSGWAYRVLGERFPFGTLAVNVAGCALIGLVMEIGLSTELLSRPARAAITVGFLGAFTTFSTFSYETLRYIEDGAWWPALANTLANVVLGLAAAWAGLSLGRAMFGGA